MAAGAKDFLRWALGWLAGSAGPSVGPDPIVLVAPAAPRTLAPVASGRAVVAPDAARTLTPGSDRP